MENVSRIKRSSNNLLFSIILYFIKSLLSFATRTVFIYFFVEEFLGLNSLFSNILTLLSLAELGFGNAIIFSMYKPIAEGDDEKVRQLLALYKKFYRIVGTLILLVGASITPFITYIIKDAPNIPINIYVVYLIFLSNTVCSYFLSFRRSLLITNQRQDIESKVGTIAVVSLNFFQILSLILFKNYYLYIILTVLFTFFENLAIFFITNKLYPQFIKNPESKLPKEEQKIITKNIFALFFHKLEYVLVCGTDNIIISAFFGASILGIYSNYALIISYIGALINFFIVAIRGSLGNYISLKKPSETLNLFKNLNFGFMWFVSWCSICLMCLFQPFVNLWLDATYLLPTGIVLLLVVSFYLNHSKYLMNTTKECAGIFWEDRYKALFTAITNIIVSLILCQYIGLAGVIWGTIISHLIPIFVEPYFVHKIYFKTKPTTYYLTYILYFITVAVLGFVTYAVCDLVLIGGILGLIIKLAICGIVPNALFVLIYFISEKFSYWLKVAKKIIKK